EVALIDLPLPDASELEGLLAGELAVPAKVPRRLDATERASFVRAALGLTLEESARAFRLAIATPDPVQALSRIVSQKKHALRQSSTLELISTDVGLSDVGGLEVLKAWLRMRVLAFDSAARAYGLDEPRGMLVCGVQGCGKSLVSKAAARVLGLPLVRLDF